MFYYEYFQTEKLKKTYIKHLYTYHLNFVINILVYCIYYVSIHLFIHLSNYFFIYFQVN